MREWETWWSLWRHWMPALLNALLSIICYVVGWNLSTSVSAMPFERSGAAATIIAIGFTLHDYRGNLQRSEDKATETVEHAAALLPLTGPTWLKRIRPRLRANTARAIRVTALTHAIVLMIATFVWGFGDMAVVWK